MFTELFLDQPWYLHAAVFGASALQAATGIGFGIIAGPIVLVALNDGVAIQISILLSFVIAVILSPSALKSADHGFLKNVFIGTVIGAPAGILAFTLMNVAFLKILAAIAALFMALMASGALARFLHADHDSTGRQVTAGVASGAMSAALAMPGPAIAAYLVSISRDKLTVRATTLAMFLFSYPIAYLVQALVTDDLSTAIRVSAGLTPATVLGIIAGTVLGHVITERIFRIILVIVLLATTAVLLLSI